ncbi:hypothetical protein LP7551_03896 [Roseibium album]|nr:hypothetical protein LP7551_03896 [Roseibium album]
MTADPFFSLTQNPEWNATIGRQGDAMNYADGYIEAALELATLILKEGKLGQRDTLVLPILYNARHSIELHLKLVIGEFHEAGVIKEAHHANHDIASHVEHIVSNEIADTKFSEILAELKPYIDSLAQIDDDGQELRYFENRDGKRSLDGHALANIIVIQQSLECLKELLDRFKYRAFDLCSEHHTETRTNKLSRRDLFAIADLLPEKSLWTEPGFLTAKKAIQEQFNIGSSQCARALDVIKDRRELKAKIGIETPLVYLSDEKAIEFVEQWKLIHPPRKKRPLGIVLGSDLAELMKDHEIDSEVIGNIERRFTLEEIADAETVFYLARDNTFSEYYEDRVSSKIKEYNATNNLRQEIFDITHKTKFLREFKSGVRKLGRLKLSDKLEEPSKIWPS